MAFTPGFENDIFISYSHYDNAAPGDEPGWVDHFHEGLESWLMRRFGPKKITIWRDKKLKGSTLFDNRIKEQIRDSALFMVLLSPNYLNSDYCRKELDLFYSEAGASRYGLSVNNESRIFNVLLKNIPHSSWPPQLKGTSGFPMHDQPEKSDEPGESLDHREILYNKKLRNIVDAVETTLKSFPGAGAGMEEVREPGKETLRIFIADTADTLQTTRDKLVADLKGEEVSIVTDIPPPWDGPAHEAAVKEAVDEARLAVHLLDGFPGRKIKGLKSATYPRSQVETGLRSLTRQLVWVPKSLEYKNIEDQEYAGFLESLERETREKAGFEFIRDEKTYLPRLVQQAIAQIRRERQVEEDDTDAPILLDTHQKDQRFAFKLADYLSGKGLRVEFNQESRDPASSLRNFEEALKHARSLVIIYGCVAPAWIHQRLKKTIQLVYSQLVDRYKTSLENRWLCLLPSCRVTGEIESLAKEFRIDFLDNRHSDSLDENVLGPLLESVKAGGAA